VTAFLKTFPGNKASPSISGAINPGILLLTQDEPQSDDASINESNQEEKGKLQDESASIKDLKPQENEPQCATIDLPKRAEKDELQSAHINDSKPKEKETPKEGRYSNDIVVVNDPVQGEDSEDGGDDTETTESEDSDCEEDEVQHDTIMTCIPKLVHQICNSNSTDTDVVAGIRQLAALAQDEDNCSRIAYCGGNLAVIQTMQSRLWSASVQGECCFALWTFAMDDDQNQQAIRDMGGMQAIVTAMTTHPDCESLQMKACGVLDTLIDDKISRQVCSTFRQSGGIQAVVNVMDAFPDSAKLRKRASSILVQLLANENADGRKAVFSAVENTHKDKDNAYVRGKDPAVSKSLL
jgi:hypothetical protein